MPFDRFSSGNKAFRCLLQDFYNEDPIDWPRRRSSSFSPFQISDRSFRFGFDELNQGFVKIVEISVTFVNRPFERAVHRRDTISATKTIDDLTEHLVHRYEQVRIEELRETGVGAFGNDGLDVHSEIRNEGSTILVQDMIQGEFAR